MSAKVPVPGSTLKADPAKGLRRKTELRRTNFGRLNGERTEQSKPGPKRRKPMKHSQPDRDWSDARTKVEYTVCRLCDDPRVECAHVMGREHDEPRMEPCPECAAEREQTGLDSIWCSSPECYVPGKRLWVNPDSVIPLCRFHHTAYDEHRADVLHTLTLEEQVRAVLDAGGIENARVRTAPLAYRHTTRETETE